MVIATVVGRIFIHITLHKSTDTTMATLQQFYDSLPDLRNGDAAHYDIVHVASGIPTHYHTIRADPPFPGIAAGGPGALRDRIRLSAAVYAQRIEASGVDAGLARAQGCCLAAVRQGIYRTWRIQTNELIAAQVINNADLNFNAALADADRLTDAVANAHYVAITDDYFPDAMISKLVKIGMGMLVCTGVVLVKTDNAHHFVDPHKSIHRSVLTQVLGRNYEIPLGMDKDDFEDIVCHKASHCVNTQLAIRMARSTDSKVRLRASGLGSAAVRLPAKYGSESAASAVLKVVLMGRSLGQMANVAVDTASVTRATRAVTKGEMDTPALRSESTDAQADVVERFGEDIAFCAGLVKGSCNYANREDPPILRSYCLKTIMTENAVQVTNGVNQMDQAFTVRRTMARRGIIGGVGLFGAEAPDATDPLPADETLAQILNAVFAAQGNAAAANQAAP